MRRPRNLYFPEAQGSVLPEGNSGSPCFGVNDAASGVVFGMRRVGWGQPGNLGDPVTSSEIIAAMHGRCVALKYVRAKFLPLGEAAKLLNGVHQQVTPVSMRLLWPNALSLAEKLRHSIYDCAYLVLAESMNCPLYTVDRKLARAAPRRCVFVEDVRRP